MDNAAAAPLLEIPADHSPAAVAKGKRTRRLRPHSPIPSGNHPAGEFLRLSPPPSSPEAEAEAEASTTSEEFETAKCLLLLSQGPFFSKPVDSAPPPKRTAGGGGAVYTCKTCSRTFSSFQALGGHRTSHRKVKIDRKSTAAVFSDDDDFPAPAVPKFIPDPLSLHLGTTTTAAAAAVAPSPRMHECSYCGAEFTSGQALGGHMRKHRPGPVTARPANFPITAGDASIEELDGDDSKRPRKGAPLDLNLPAPDDENSKFGLARSPQEAETGPRRPPLTPLLIHKV
ncbi:zinc finger protein ZAT5-like [Andrographis paniculata]|uniref:zinc finger protein ZAT5-like n=1 Tax=Andrographis paniculata TaxID=175694 RepID=UPI0021E91E8C|nr:zinc finger protein ZAT5-like [Andrographis paniculata]